MFFVLFFTMGVLSNDSMLFLYFNFFTCVGFARLLL